MMDKTEEDVKEMEQVLREEISFLQRQMETYAFGSPTYVVYAARANGLKIKLAEIDKPAEIIIPAIYRDALIISTQRSHRFQAVLIKSIEEYVADPKNVLVPLAQLAEVAVNMAEWKKELADYEAILKILGAQP